MAEAVGLPWPLFCLETLPSAGFFLPSIPANKAAAVPSFPTKEVLSGKDVQRNYLKRGIERGRQYSPSDIYAVTRAT
jgi:hypothetical protein